MSASITYNHANLYVEEVFTEHLSNRKTTTDIGYAVWYMGVVIGHTFYGESLSGGTLLQEGEILCVNTNHCYKKYPSRNFAGYTEYHFGTEPDQLPEECYQLRVMKLHELSKEVQDALSGVLTAYKASRMLSA